MITLTDGTKTIALTKDEMEIIEEGLQWGKATAASCDALGWAAKIDAIFDKLRGLKYE